MPVSPLPDRRILAFLILCVVAVGVSVGYIVWRRAGAVDSSPVSELPTREIGTSLADLQARPHMFFRDTSLGTSHGRLAVASLDSTDGARKTTSLACERVHVASGHGVCLTADRGFVTTYGAFVFGQDLVPRHSFALPGVPSRVRVSPDGSRAGITVFVSGDSYAPGSFSTRTFVIDAETGKPLEDLEQYTILRDGKPFKAIDFNFWGITFRDRGHIYATLGTGGQTYLVEADVDSKTGRVIHSGVECPSLSPDQRRIAFKKRESAAGRLVWRLHVLNLETGVETALAESRSVDDQPEWLDSGTVTYGLASDGRPGSTDVWGVPSDGTGAPRRLLPAAWSLAVVRPVAQIN